MAKPCSGKCHREYETLPILNYTKDWPKCRNCRIRINYEGKYCPCCEQQLSLRVVNTTNRGKNYVPALVKWRQRRK